MTALRARQPHPSGSARRPGATFGSRRAEAGTVVLTVGGEIDAANAGQLTDWVSGHLPDDGRLVLDCSDVTFFAVEGFSALQRVNVVCAHAGVSWILLPSVSVSRVMQLCNPGGSLVPDGSVDAAVIPLRAGRPPRLRLVRNN